MPHCVPLHVHSHFSLLEGVDAPDALLARAAICGYSALALTDSNNLYGAVAFTEASRHHGVRPILGACLRHGSQRCTVLIADAIGYASLCRVLSRLHLQSPPSLFESVPLDFIKIDGALMQGLASNPTLQQQVRSIAEEAASHDAARQMACASMWSSGSMSWSGSSPVK